MHSCIVVFLALGLAMLLLAAQPCHASAATGLSAGQHQHYRCSEGTGLAWDPSMLPPYQHSIQPEVPTNGVRRRVFDVSMSLLWVLFGVLGVWRLPLLHLWLVLGVATIIIGFILLGPMNKYHSG